MFSPKGRTEQGGLRVSSCSSLSSLFQVRTRMQSGLSPPPTPTPGLPAQCLMLGRQAVVVSAQWSFKILGGGVIDGWIRNIKCDKWYSSFFKTPARNKGVIFCGYS